MVRLLLVLSSGTEANVRQVPNISPENLAAAAFSSIMWGKPNRRTAMQKTLGLMLLACVTATASKEQQAQQVWSASLSDSMCAASHQMKAAAGKMSERECLFECLKALAKYVLVDDKQQVIAIANQDLGGLPLYA